MKTAPTSPQSNRIYVRCTCHKILAHRVETSEGWLLELRYGKRIPTITSAHELIITCSGKGCEMMHRITPTEGIVHTVRESYDRRIPTRSAGRDGRSCFAATG